MCWMAKDIISLTLINLDHWLIMIDSWNEIKTYIGTRLLNTRIVNLWEQTCFTNWCYFIYQGHCGRGERSGMMVRHTTDYWIHPWNVLKKSTNYSVLCQICKQVKFLIWSRKCELPGLLFDPQTWVCSDFSSETSWGIPRLCCMEPTPPCGLLCIFCIETKRESKGIFSL